MESIYSSSTHPNHEEPCPRDATRLAPCAALALLADTAVLLPLLVNVHNGLQLAVSSLSSSTSCLSSLVLGGYPAGRDWWGGKSDVEGCLPRINTCVDMWGESGIMTGVY